MNSDESPPAPQAQRLRQLIAAGTTLVSEREPDRVLDRLLEIARELTGARYAAIGILDHSRRALARFTTSGVDPATHAAIGTLPRGHGVLGLLISRPEPLRLADVGVHESSYGFPPGHPIMRTFLGVPILIAGEPWGNLYLADKPTEFDEADEEAVVALAAWGAIAVENARLYQQTDQRRSELERSVRALEATTEIARAVGGETSLERVLELIAKRTRALVEASGLAILLKDGEDFVVAAMAGRLPRDIVGARVAPAQSIAGRVVGTGRPERVSDISSSLRFALRDVGVVAHSGVFVPLVFRGESLGVIEAFDRLEGPEFGPEDERMMLAAAASAATAVATAQTVERDRLRRTINAAEAERGRWARELHDETLQGLAALRVLLAGARHSEDPQALRRSLDDAIEELGGEIANLRSLITDLRPAALDELGLPPALEALFDRIRTVHGIQVDAILELDYGRRRQQSRLDTDTETTVYRLIQEALSNVAHHAQARRAEVEVHERRDQLLVAVSDDGRGFDPSAPAAGFGLSGMRERVSLAGGTLEIATSPAGTRIEARLPLSATVRQSA